LDLGDCWSLYCVLDEAGQMSLEQKLATTPEAMKQTFGKMPGSLIPLETGTHSPWVSRLLTELGPASLTFSLILFAGCSGQIGRLGIGE
jgi:transposase